MFTRSFIRAGVAALLVESAPAACGTDAPDGAGTAGAGGAAPTAGAASGAAATASATQGEVSPGDNVEFVATEFAFTPSALTAMAGTYSGTLVNEGTIKSSTTSGSTTATQSSRPAGETVEFEFEVPEEGIRYHCSIPGHAEAGMEGIIRTGATPQAESADTHGDSGDSGDMAAVEADPDAPQYEWRDPRAPARGEGEGFTLVPGGAPDGGDLIDVEMVVEEKLATVAEGYVQQIWTFNGTMPGPVIRTEVGDTVRVHLINPPEATASHSVDFHASQVAWNDEMRSIAPGEELIYEFTTDYAGVWMYHCGTDPVLHHIANGMFGMVIVEPEGGLPPMDNEFFIVQHEWYLGPQGEVSSFTKANQAARARFRHVQRRSVPVQGQPDRDPDRRRGPAVRARRRAVDRLGVPHRRDDLRRCDQGRCPSAARQRRQLGIAGGRSGTGTRCGHRTEGRGGRALPDGDPRLQLPGSGSGGPAAGRRRRTVIEDVGPCSWVAESGRL